jgi:uncharacterized membrane protein
MSHWRSRLVRVLPAALVAGAIVWPVALGAAAAARMTGAPRAWTTVVYAMASTVCHQRPDRSFHTAGVQWPVCGRCAGLYLAAPMGAVFALFSRRRRRAVRDRASIAWLAIAALPTAATLALEWSGLSTVTSIARAAAALPLGAALAFVVVRSVSGRDASIGYTDDRCRP